MVHLPSFLGGGCFWRPWGAGATGGKFAILLGRSSSSFWNDKMIFMKVNNTNEDWVELYLICHITGQICIIILKCFSRKRITEMKKKNHGMFLYISAKNGNLRVRHFHCNFFLYCIHILYEFFCPWPLMNWSFVTLLCIF